MNRDLVELQKRIGVSFQNENFLKEACTHRSYLNENTSWPIPHNERLEFLGDAVLELVITEKLFKKYPHEDEGRLTSIRAALVNYVSLASSARDILLDDYLYMSKGEEKDTGRAREVILANAFEALIGAIYLDQGYEVVARFIDVYVFSHTQEVIDKQLFKDAKSLFQEQAQEKFKITPAYQVLEERGPDHKKEFVVGVFLKEKKIAEGKGYAKQEAEIDAAKNALENLKE
jgi:ribonuclease-3